MLGSVLNVHPLPPSVFVGEFAHRSAFTLSLPLILLRSSSSPPSFFSTPTHHPPTHPLHTQMCLCACTAHLCAVCDVTLSVPTFCVAEENGNSTNKSKPNHRIYYICTHTHKNTLTHAPLLTISGMCVCNIGRDMLFLRVVSVGSLRATAPLHQLAPRYTHTHTHTYTHIYYVLERE